LWKGSVWMDGQSTRGVACDCVGFVHGVLDALYPIVNHEPRPSFPKLVSLHQKGSGLIVGKWFRRRYASIALHEGIVEPGNIIVSITGSAGDVGHVYIVGPQKNTVWHCVDPNGVCMTGLGTITQAGCWACL